MPSMELHTLYGAGLKEKLVKAGVIERLPKKLAILGYTHRIFYERCNKAAWKEQLKKVLEAGVVNFALKKPDGSGYGVRRDYTEKEKAELGWYPVAFEASGNEMLWSSAWTSLDDPAYYASCAIPDQTLIFAKYFEGADDGGCYMRGGEVVVDKPVIEEASIEEMLTAAIAALKSANLEAFAEDLQKRFSDIVAPKGRDSEQQRISLLLDYVSIKWDAEDNNPWYIPPEAEEAEDGVKIQFEDDDLPF